LQQRILPQKKQPQPSLPPRRQPWKKRPLKAVTPEAAKIEVFTGRIASIDTTKNEIVVKDDKTKVEKTIAVDAKEIGKLKVGKREGRTESWDQHC
jgi:hypothetical protein